MTYQPKNKNALINGDFNAWQRGTSFTGITGSAVPYLADRWYYSCQNDAVVDITADADVPTVSQSGHLSNNSLKFDVTTADGTIAASQYAVIVQKVEGYNWAPLAQNATTISFWVKAVKTGTYCIALVNSGGDRTVVKEYTVFTTNTWEKKILTFPASPQAGTWDYTDGIGVHVIFTIAAGSDFQTTADAWQTGNFLATSNQVNGIDNAANNFFISQAQYEKGEAATEFEYREFSDEIAKCQRYYVKSPAIDSAIGADGFILGAAVSIVNNKIGSSVFYPVEMRTAPTINLWDDASASGQVTWYIHGTGPFYLTSFATFIYTRSFSPQSTATDANIANLYVLQYTADAEL